MTAPVEKILIANRGEIAVRIAQTCRQMGIGVVAIHSTEDAGALHVQVADEAYCVGPAPALESYLKMDVILAAARDSGAEAIHPGYGFLAENAHFARAVQEAGLVWIGPSPDAIALMGDKVAAKELARSVGVPTAPDYSGEDQSDERLQLEAERVGFPVLIKAAAGGGGKGMRVVDHAGALVEAVAAARREAKSAFGDGRIFLEKFLPRARHIEIQVLLDAAGRGVFLGERDCSLQRRHQKVVEETPSPVMTAELRLAMGEAALRLARAGRYCSAGTVEFLFSGDSFYFLEMNTRIQVEHPVTEVVTGVDLIRAQIEIAAGLPLGMTQLDVRINGHAIEARLYAEDPTHDFLPATGTIRVFRPPQGPGIRSDVGVSAGATVTQWYDPLLAKLIVFADNRTQAVEQLRRCLEEYAVLGVRNNLSFLHWLACQEEFASGNVDTEYIARRWRPGVPELPDEVLLGAALFEVTDVPDSSLAGDLPFNPWSMAGGWRAGGSPRTLSYRYGGEERSVAVARGSSSEWSVTAQGKTRSVRAQRPDNATLLAVEGPRVLDFAVCRIPEGLEVEWRGTSYRLETARLQISTRKSSSHGEASLTAPMTGTVVKVAVEKGQRVEEHETLVVLEAMKMEHVIEAPHRGIVQGIFFHEGDLVQPGEALVQLEQA